MAENLLQNLREAIDETESALNHLKMENKYLKSQVKLACEMCEVMWNVAKADGSTAQIADSVGAYLARNSETGWLP